ncbi:ferrochelatase [Liquorilactobacillus uvarum]|uniref:Coproporphyrin III ferrochelatase n=1 Tax=Liquorilactobacillus uvarum DSM 19971 TaxID=1423812 RepID=A0A0R1Q323_9LACO|nr:ferrochelatase [Liquorilactobacillus uvarum]KRL39046.1 ferrochelatase [Liquorilactobacillus uvarum DSM 19971]
MDVKKGVLLINLGTPKTPTEEDVRVYLKHFLGDPRVIDMPRWKWKPILNLMILPHRPAKSAKLYQQIWSDEHGSPLQYYTEQQTKKLQNRLPDYIVKYAMSYSAPFIADVLESFELEHVDSLTIIPLYPQYSTTTVGSVVDDINHFYYKRTYIPSLHIITDFCESKVYIQALSDKIKKEYNEFKPDKVLLSYHGIPVSYVKKGDPYQERCNLTTELIMKQLDGIPYMQTFQSRFGPDEWLTPSTDTTLKELPAKGVKKVLIVSPSFVSDCLETLHELDIENREYFLESGGVEFKMLPALNDDEAFIDVLEQLITQK